MLNALTHTHTHIGVQASRKGKNHAACLSWLRVCVCVCVGGASIVGPLRFFVCVQLQCWETQRNVGVVVVVVRFRFFFIKYQGKTPERTYISFKFISFHFTPCVSCWRFNFIPHTQCIHIDVSNFCTLLQTRTPMYVCMCWALGAAVQEKSETRAKWKNNIK